MNKKILAAAVAAAMVAPAAALANDVTVYGIAHVSIDYLDSDNQGIDGFDIASRASRLGFKGTEDLANGLKAIWKMEFGVDIADAGQCPGDLNGALALTGSPTVGQGGFTGRCTGNAVAPCASVRRTAHVATAGSPTRSRRAVESRRGPPSGSRA